MRSAPTPSCWITAGTRVSYASEATVRSGIRGGRSGPTKCVEVFLAAWLKQTIRTRTIGEPAASAEAVPKPVIFKHGRSAPASHQAVNRRESVLFCWLPAFRHCFGTDPRRQWLVLRAARLIGSSFPLRRLPDFGTMAAGRRLGHGRYFNLFHCNYEHWRRCPWSSALHVRRTALQLPIAAADSNGRELGVGLDAQD